MAPRLLAAALAALAITSGCHEASGTAIRNLEEADEDFAGSSIDTSPVVCSRELNAFCPPNTKCCPRHRLSSSRSRRTAGSNDSNADGGESAASSSRSRPESPRTAGAAPALHTVALDLRSLLETHIASGAMGDGSPTAAAGQLATTRPADPAPGAASGAPPGTEPGAAANPAAGGLPADVAVPIQAPRELQQLTTALLESHGSQILCFAKRGGASGVKIAIGGDLGAICPFGSRTSVRNSAIFDPDSKYHSVIFFGPPLLGRI